MDEFIDDEYKVELDPSKPLVLLIGNQTYSEITTPLKASGKQYKRKSLYSSPENWISIAELLDTFAIQAVLVQLNAQAYFALSHEAYAAEREQLFRRVACLPHVVFVHEEIYSGVDDEEDGEPLGIPSVPPEVCQSVNEFLRKLDLNIMLYKRNVEMIMVAVSLIEDTEGGLLFRIYIPNDRLWSGEIDRLLQLFRDYLSRVAGLSVRLDQIRTDRGTVVEFHGHKDDTQQALSSHFQEFSCFLDLCANDPGAAEALLIQRKLGTSEITRILSKYSKEAKRLQIDLKHERERESSFRFGRASKQN